MDYNSAMKACPFSGIGKAQNVIFNPGDAPIHEHEFEDQSFMLTNEGGGYFVYAVLDGHDGKGAADFSAKRLISKISKIDFQNDCSTRNVKDFLSSVIIQTDDEFKKEDYISKALKQKKALRNELPPDIDIYSTHRRFPKIARLLEEVEASLCSSASIVLSLLIKNQLFVATCGSCRGVLCKMKEDKFEVLQLSQNHTLTSEDERARISMLNIDVDLIEDLRFTRCLGNHALKEFYSEYELYKNATNCPVIAEPDTVVYDSFKSDFCGFLLLFTKGLDQAIRDSGLLRVDSDADDFEISEAVNELLCYMVAEEMFQHETIEQVSQAVVDRVTHRHHELHTRPDHSVFLRRDDITLLIRNFRHPLQKAGDKKTAPTLFDGLPGLKEAKISDIAKKFEPLSIDLGKTESTVTQVSADVLSIRSEEESHNLNDMSIDESLATSSSSRTDVSDYIIESNDRQQLPLDDRGCVYAYVSFTDLKEQVLKSSKAFKTIQDFI